jgi:hypothetical protein
MVGAVDAVLARLHLRFLGSGTWGFRQALAFDRMGVGKNRMRAAKWWFRQWLVPVREAMLGGIP